MYVYIYIYIDRCINNLEARGFAHTNVIERAAESEGRGLRVVKRHTVALSPPRGALCVLLKSMSLLVCTSG